MYIKIVFFWVFFERIACFCEGKSKWGIRSENTSDLLGKNKQFPQKKWTICSFIMSNLRESLTVAHAHMSWATWMICSQWLICPERSQRIAHSHSFDLSNLSKWANEWWVKEQIPNPDITIGVKNLSITRKNYFPNISSNDWKKFY